MELDDFALFFFGIGSCILGWHLLNNSTYSGWRMGTADFGSFHWVIGSMFIGVGLVAVVHPLHKFYREWRRNR